MGIVAMRKPTSDAKIFGKSYCRPSAAFFVRVGVPHLRCAHIGVGAGIQNPL